MKKLFYTSTGVFFVTSFLSVGNIFSQTNVFDDIIATSPNHSSLEAALIAANLDDDLQNVNGTFTVFAPDNTAFDNLAAELGTTVNGLLALPNLADILLYHVLGTEVNAAAVSNGAVVTPLFTGNSLKLTKTTTNGVFVNQAQVTTADLTADNGIVHVTNAVVLPRETVVDVAIDNGFTSLVAAVVQARLLPALTDPFSTLTVFAPTNQAFTDLATALDTDINGLLALPNLSDVLTYHVLGSEVPASGVNNGAIVSPLFNGNTLKLTKTTGGDVFVNQAEVTMADVEAENGVVHVIDAVVLPSETVVDVAIDNGFTTLVAAVVEGRLLPALTDPFSTLTVFAPTNQAFDQLAAALGVNATDLLSDPNLVDVLTYHVLGTEVEAADVTNGAIVTPLNPANTLKMTKTTTGNVFANQAQVTTADVGADNGVVHVINSVLLPLETVVDVAIDNDFTALTAAVIKAELLPVLTNPLELFTVFAPTDQAFTNLATALNTDLNGILALPNLADVLTYHVVSGFVESTDLVNGPVETVNGADVIINLTGGVKVNDANVTTADVEADNGIVHIIDKVILETFLGLNEASKEKISMYPNPASDQVIIQGFDKGAYRIVNNLGEIVAQGTVNGGLVDVSKIAHGIYQMEILQDNKQYVGRLVKN